MFAEAEKVGAEILFNNNLAILLKEVRGERSLREFAELIGATHVSLRAWESGKGEPRMRVLGKIAQMKGWTLDQMESYLEGGQMPSEPQVQQLLAQIRSLPFSEAAQVAQVALETMSVKGEQTS